MHIPAVDLRETDPFLRRMCANPEVDKLAQEYVVLHMLLERMRDSSICNIYMDPSARWDCEDLLNEARDKIRRGIEFSFNVLMRAIEVEYADYKGLPDFPATYTGSVYVDVTGCGDGCNDTDTMTITLREDGTLIATWNFNIILNSDGCSFEHPGGRVKNGIHDKNGNFTIPDHNIVGTYVKGYIEGSGTVPRGNCNVTMSFELYPQ
jgi:hypothetical protein